MNCLQLLKDELRPAMGCTEPAAVALAVARARELLQNDVQSVELKVSGNILKNAMGVGIPGTGMHGIKIAAAMAAISGSSSRGLEVLEQASGEDCSKAAELAERVSIDLAKTDERLYIEARVNGGGDSACVIIAGSHTNFMRACKNGKAVELEPCQKSSTEKAGEKTSIREIWEFISTVPITELEFLQDTIDMNSKIAGEGLSMDYGMALGRTLLMDTGYDPKRTDLATYISAVAAAGADARMSGCSLPVMSTAGSGNQGLTASLPVMAAAEKLGSSKEMLFRALALSQLVTIHIKSYIGKLSALCGCAIAASAGVACALCYMQGGGLDKLYCAVQNMVADISGLICDGAKETCSLKIATAVSGAVQCAALAKRGIAATEKDGIVECQVEKSLCNLGRLGNQGMVETDRVILDMMICK